MLNDFGQHIISRMFRIRVWTRIARPHIWPIINLEPYDMTHIPVLIPGFL